MTATASGGRARSIHRMHHLGNRCTSGFRLRSTIHPRTTRRSALSVALLVLCLLGPPGVSSARGQLGTPVEIAGYWDRSEMDDPETILGDLRFAVWPTARTRTFGATGVRTFFGGNQGIHLFTDSMLPQFNVKGERTIVDRFIAAPPNRKVIARGTFGRGTLSLTEVEIEGPDL
jgi:hypothetical protein